MTRRKPMYNIGDEIVVEDSDKTFIILDRQPFLQKDPTQPRGKRGGVYHGWEYWVQPVDENKRKGTKVKRTKVKQLWVDQTSIVGKVLFHPVVDALTPARHMELADELPGYGDLREFMERLPVTKGTKGTIRTLKELLENLALYHAGTSREQADAGEEIGFALR